MRTLKQSKAVDVQTSEVDAMLEAVNFDEKKKYGRGGRLKVKIHVLFYGESHRSLAHRQVNQLKVVDIPTSFI
jgi:hypothetical protein